MKSKLRELIAWELQDNWSFPILEIIVAITILQALSLTTIMHDTHILINNIIKPFFANMSFVIIIAAAIVFGRSFGESIEKRKLVVLLSYPPSRTQVFAAKYLANLLTLFLIFGFALLAQGISVFLFEGLFPPAVWAFTFLYLLLTVFLAGSLMTLMALALKRFGLSILIFLIYMFGMEYWVPGNIRNPVSYLSLGRGPWASVDYSINWYTNWLNIGITASGWVSQNCFLTAIGYTLFGGMILLLASLFLINRIDLD